MSEHESTIDRVALLKDAVAIEAAGGEWKVIHVMAVLDCAKSTVYNTPWLLQIARPVGKRGMRFSPAEVRNRGPLASERHVHRARPRRTGS